MINVSVGTSRMLTTTLDTIVSEPVAFRPEMQQIREGPEKIKLGILTEGLEK